jgi:hypothetical protein
MQRSRHIIALAVAVLASGGLLTDALAKDKMLTNKNLPGVNVPDPIVKPQQDSALQTSPDAYGDGFVRMGNWDVKISGYARVDIGVGNIPSNGR